MIAALITRAVMPPALVPVPILFVSGSVHRIRGRPLEQKRATQVVGLRGNGARRCEHRSYSECLAFEDLPPACLTSSRYPALESAPTFDDRWRMTDVGALQEERHSEGR